LSVVNCSPHLPPCILNCPPPILAFLEPPLPAWGPAVSQRDTIYYVTSFKKLSLDFVNSAAKLHLRISKIIATSALDGARMNEIRFRPELCRYSAAWSAYNAPRIVLFPFSTHRHILRLVFEPVRCVTCLLTSQLRRYQVILPADGGNGVQ